MLKLKQLFAKLSHNFCNTCYDDGYFTSFSNDGRFELRHLDKTVVSYGDGTFIFNSVESDAEYDNVLAFLGDCKHLFDAELPFQHMKDSKRPTMRSFIEDVREISLGRHIVMRDGGVFAC